jgi:putative nucleotidyltransferase with HDIG domain
MADIIDLWTLRNKIDSINSLPTIPSTLRKIVLMLEKPRISLDDLGRFISNDPALTIKVLKMVNSAAYGFPGRISSVSHAIMLLGLNVIKGLLLGVSVFELMQKTMDGLWEHSIGCAVVARVIARKKQIKDPEEVSVSGLLHDIGKAILMLQFPEEFAQAIKKAETEEITLYDAEKSFFAATHADVGHWLAQKWNFPQNLVEAIAFHHQPNLSKQTSLDTAIIHVSDVLVRSRGVGFAGDFFVPAVHPATWEMLKLSEQDVMDILSILEASAASVEDIS